MKDIIWFAVFVSCLHALIPLTKSKAIRSSISLLSGLAVLCVICMPVGTAVESIRGLPQYFVNLFTPIAEEVADSEIDSERWVIRYGVKNIECGVQRLIASRFSLDSGCVYVEVVTGVLGDGAVSVEQIRVFLREDAPCADAAVESYISDMLACPCKIIRWEG